jgi:response regulator RpfG family c-di-GMP phosphodiesterase
MDTGGKNIDLTSGSAQNTAQKILLIDLDDARRQSRVKMLESVGYEVETRANYIAAEQLDHESRFDLIIVTLHSHPEDTAAYSDHLSRTDPKLPILLLTDTGVFVPNGTLSESVGAGSTTHLIQTVSAMLVGSDHMREPGEA